MSKITWQGCSYTYWLTSVWKWDWSVKSCLSEHTLKTKWTHFKSHKIKVIAIVYWESVKLMIFSPEWIFHVCWLSLDTLPNMYPIFHVWLSTSEKRSVNHNSNLIKVVVFAQYWEVGLRWWFSIHWGNITTLMRFELWLTLLLSLVLIRTWNIGYNMLGRVSRDHQRAWNIHSVLKIINLTLSQYTIAITLILWLLKCVNFVFNVCSLMHDSTDHSHFHTEGSQLV